MARNEQEIREAVEFINRIDEHLGDIEGFRDMLTQNELLVIESNLHNDETKSIILKRFLKILAISLEILTDPLRNAFVEEPQALVDVITEYGHDAKSAWYEFFERGSLEGYNATDDQDEKNFFIGATTTAAAFMAKNQSFDIDEVEDRWEEGQIVIPQPIIHNAVVAFLANANNMLNNQGLAAGR